MHNAPRVFGWLEPWYQRFATAALQTPGDSAGGNATLGLATFMSVPNTADPDVMLQRSFDDGD